MRADNYLGLFTDITLLEGAKRYEKAISISFILALFPAILLTGCTNKTQDHTSQPQADYAKVEVYNASNPTLINTIDIESERDTFDEKTSPITDVKFSVLPEDAEERYQFVAYKESAVVFNDGEPEKIFTVTTYANTDVIRMEVESDSLGRMNLPDD